MAGLNKSDLIVLAALARFRFLTAKTIAEKCFHKQARSTSIAWTSRRLKKLRERGLISSEYAFGRTQVHYLTERGAALMNCEPGSVKLAEYFHDTAVTDLAFYLEEEKKITLVTERQARAIENDAENNPYAIPITRASGNTGHAWPDLISTHASGEYIGYEIEYTPKSKRRLLLLMLGYAYASAYRYGVYFTTPASQNVVAAAANEANEICADRGLGRPITTRTLTDYIPLEGHHER